MTVTRESAELVVRRVSGGYVVVKDRKGPSHVFITEAELASQKRMRGEANGGVLIVEDRS